jgi:hypothetical protein
MTADLSVHTLVDLFDEIGPEVAAAGRPEDALSVITNRCLSAVRGAEHAGITRASESGFETAAPTSDLVPRVDAIQYELRSGPCVDAAVEATIYRAGDLRTDTRWPEFGKRAAETTGVLSMMSFRMYFEDEDYIAAMNLYSSEAKAFDEEAELYGLALTTYGAMAVTSSRRLERITNLERALASNRDIGVAIGVLMGLHRVTREQAFDLLRVASQGKHRKLADIAHDVAETGSLDFV